LLLPALTKRSAVMAEACRLDNAILVRRYESLPSWRTTRQIAYGDGPPGEDRGRTLPVGAPLTPTGACSGTASETLASARRRTRCFLVSEFSCKDDSRWEV
jgi:hypothetical protein